MKLDHQLTRLRTKHGPGAIDAYNMLRDLLQKIELPVVFGLDEVFERHGALATAAAFRLHAERARGMADMVHEKQSGRDVVVSRPPKKK